MAGKKHNIGKFWSYSDRERLGITEYRTSETLCGLHFKETDRNPFAVTSEDVTCEWCLKIMNTPPPPIN